VLTNTAQNDINWSKMHSLLKTRQISLANSRLLRTVYNRHMRRSFLFPRLLTVATLILLAMSLVSNGQAPDTAKRGRKYKMPPPTSRVEVTVLRASNGKPIENASVIFHPLQDGRENGNMELKTNDEGKSVIDLLTTGSMVRLQIIAPGFQTYGGDYKIAKDNETIEVKLKRPTEQYSIYKKTEGNAPSADKPEPKSDSDKEAPVPDSKDNPKSDSKPQAAPK